MQKQGKLFKSVDESNGTTTEVTSRLQFDGPFDRGNKLHQLAVSTGEEFDGTRQGGGIIHHILCNTALHDVEDI